MHRWIPQNPFVLLAAISLIALSCDHSFNPIGPPDTGLIVFSIFSTDRSAQFVRVSSPHAPDDPNSSFIGDTGVTDARIILRQPSKEYYTADNYDIVYAGDRFFKDTVLFRPAGSLEGSPVYLYGLDPFTPEPGQTYILIVSSPSHGSAAATLIMPPMPTLDFHGSYSILSNPLGYDRDVPIEFSVKLPAWLPKNPTGLPPGPQGYMTRLYVDYDVQKDGVWVSERAEVPLSSANPVDYTLDYPVYPKMVPWFSDDFVVQYKNGYLKSVILDLANNRYATNKLIFRRVVFMFLEADRNLCAYYALAHVEDDPRSVRLDTPFFPRMTGGGSYGRGMVGAYTLASLYRTFPADFVLNHQ
jgi:hypothetical protein